MNPFHFVSLFLLASAPFAHADPIIIPFQKIGKLIVLKSTIDSIEGNFIFDTGVPNLILNSKYFSGGDATDRDFFGIGGKASEIRTIRVQLTLPSLGPSYLIAEIIDLSQIEKVKNLEIHGLLGTRIFENYQLVIDYIFQEITLYPLGKKGTPSTLRLLHQTTLDTLPFRQKGSMPVIETKLGNQAINLAIDTGAGINVIDTKTYHKLLVNPAKVKTRTIGGFSEKVQKVSTFDLDAVHFGSSTFDEMPTAVIPIYRLNKVLRGRRIDGILGYEFLHQFRIGFNFKKKEIYIWPKELVDQRWASLGKNK